MEIIGKIHKVYQPESGTSDNGNDWVRQTVVIETMKSRPKKLALTIMGEKRAYDWEGAKEGDIVQVGFEPRSREHDGKWFSELSAYSVRFMDAK